MKDLQLPIFLMLELAKEYARQNDEAPKIDVQTVLGIRFEKLVNQSKDCSRELSKQVQIIHSGEDSVGEQCHNL